MDRPPFFALVHCTPWREGFIPYEVMSGGPPPLLPSLREQQLAELSSHSFLKSLYALQSSLKASHWTIWEIWPTSESTTSFPLFQFSDMVWLKGSHGSTETNLERTLCGDSLHSYGYEGSWHYTIGPSHPDQKSGSHGCWQMDCLWTMDPLKLGFQWVPGSFLLYLFLRLMSDMNTGLWSNLCHPQV